MRIFDTHLHLANERLAPDLDLLLAQAREVHIEGGLIACDPCDQQMDHTRALQIIREHEGYYLSVGCHPQNALRFSEDQAKTIRSIAERPSCRCIGEIGLDYCTQQSTKDQQMAVLIRQMDLALELNKPVQLHIRNAHGDMIDLLRRRKAAGSLPQCFLHCFTRSFELAKAYLSLGCYISFAGTITFSNARKLAETVRIVPIDRILIETDAPWAAPEAVRGKRCEPAHLLHTFEKIAALRNLTPEELADQLWQNTSRLLGI